MLMKRQSRCSVSPTDVYPITLLRYLGKYILFRMQLNPKKGANSVNLVPFCLSGICAWHFSTTYLYTFRLRA
jgi:hypothetical protein